MTYNPQIHHRRSTRLKGYDYSQAGVYFITICTYNRECLFGEIVNGEMRLNEYGEMARDEWLKTSILRPNVELKEWVVMPNHIHGIVVIVRRGVLQYAPTMDTDGDTPDRGVLPTPDRGVLPTLDRGVLPTPDRGVLPTPDRGVLPTPDRGVLPTPDRGVLQYAPTTKLQSPSQTIGAIVRGFKSATTKHINEMRIDQGVNNTPLSVWQRNYWEHIIRNEESYRRIVVYIIDNPAQWKIDKLYMESKP